MPKNRRNPIPDTVRISFLKLTQSYQLPGLVIIDYATYVST